MNPNDGMNFKVIMNPEQIPTLVTAEKRSSIELEEEAAIERQGKAGKQKTIKKKEATGAGAVASKRTGLASKECEDSAPKSSSSNYKKSGDVTNDKPGVKPSQVDVDAEATKLKGKRIHPPVGGEKLNMSRKHIVYATDNSGLAYLYIDDDDMKTTSALSEDNAKVDADKDTPSVKKSSTPSFKEIIEVTARKSLVPCALVPCVKPSQVDVDDIARRLREKLKMSKTYAASATDSSGPAYIDDDDMKTMPASKLKMSKTYAASATDNSGPAYIDDDDMKTMSALSEDNAKVDTDTDTSSAKKSSTPSFKEIIEASVHESLGPSVMKASQVDVDAIARRLKEKLEMSKTYAAYATDNSGPAYIDDDDTKTMPDLSEDNAKVDADKAISSAKKSPTLQWKKSIKIGSQKALVPSRVRSRRGEGDEQLSAATVIEQTVFPVSPPTILSQTSSGDTTPPIGPPTIIGEEDEEGHVAPGVVQVAGRGDVEKELSEPNSTAAEIVDEGELENIRQEATHEIRGEQDEEGHVAPVTVEVVDRNSAGDVERVLRISRLVLADIVDEDEMDTIRREAAEEAQVKVRQEFMANVIEAKIVHAPICARYYSWFLGAGLLAVVALGLGLGSLL